MNDEIWSNQFYKALIVVGKLTEEEKLRLGNILIALNGVKSVSVSKNQLPDRNAKPLPLRQIKEVL